jgi:hypothetical protein
MAELYYGGDTVRITTALAPALVPAAGAAWADVEAEAAAAAAELAAAAAQHAAAQQAVAAEVVAAAEPGWTCVACTLVNDAAVQSCAVCDSVRPLHGA